MCPTQKPLPLPPVLHKPITLKSPRGLDACARGDWTASCCLPLTSPLPLLLLLWVRRAAANDRRGTTASVCVQGKEQANRDLSREGHRRPEVLRQLCASTRVGGFVGECSDSCNQELFCCPRPTVLDKGVGCFGCVRPGVSPPPRSLCFLSQ